MSLLTSWTEVAGGVLRRQCNVIAAVCHDARELIICGRSANLAGDTGDE
jgi:hypothetical protein